MTRFFANLLLMVCCALSAAAAGPNIAFKETTHDFGNIRENGGPVTCAFTYTNTGSAPLAIITVSTTCGCTSTKFSPRPLAPGKSETVQVTFNPNGRSGEFNSLITVRTNVQGANGKKKKEILKISGNVIPQK